MTTLLRDWDEDVVRQYLTPESHQKSREEFERTHIDIDKIKSDYLFPHQSNEEFITQEEFRDAILKSNITDDNRIFILRGETGSGKSQLCQWLEYQIGSRHSGTDETHVALHVSRSQTRIEDIVEILTEPIDIDIQVGNVEDLNPEKVAEAMIANLDAYAPTAFQELAPDEVEQLIAERSGTDLRSILENNIRDYQEAVASDGDEDIPDLLDEGDYRELSISAFGRAKGGQTIFPTLLGFLHDELSGKLNVGNFQDKLEQISDAYVEEGLRPVLICEDLTTFSVLKEQLLDHIFQLDSGHYDVVLGWTTGWEKDSLDNALGTSENTYTYMKDRAEGYLSTTDETGQAYFLTEDVTVELARKYVSVIREESEQETNGEIPEDAFDDLYPFNAEFIRRSYEHLIQDGNERRTPRLLLIRIVRECLTATAPPFKSIDGNPYIKQFPAPVPLELPADVQNLAKWYGIPSADQNIQLPQGILDTFNVAVPDNALDDGDPVILPTKGGTAPETELRLEQVGGKIEPGATITIKATLNGRPEQEADINIDGEPAGFTRQDGTLNVELPSKEGEVTIGANKKDLSDHTTVTVGRDSLSLSVTPSHPEEGEDITVTARFNGETTNDVTLYKEGDRIGTTDADGTLSLTANDPPEMDIRGEFESVEDSTTVQVASGGDYPVETDLSPDEVDQRRFEYEQWLKRGDEYNSSDTLRNGAVAVLEKWHEPIRLANPNSSATGVTGIYYTRGSETPVSIQSVNERKGLSIELPFGTEHNDTYEPLLWCGISDDESLPAEDRYQLNYNLLRGWASDRVAEFQAEMREDIESELPDGWTIEEFIIVAQYLLMNAGNGTTTLSRDLVFRYHRTSDNHDHFILEWSSDHPYRLAYNNLTKSSSVPADLAEGFFKLKENFVDNKRLNEAYESVEANLDEYIKEAMYINDDLYDAYRLGTTRSNATVHLESVFTRVKEYAQELHSLGPDDVEHVVSAVENVDEWFDSSHDVPQLRRLYDRLYDAVGTLEVNIREKWETQRERLEEGEDIHMAAFQSDIEKLREIEAASGPELVQLLHRFQESKAERIEWEIYESLAEMVSVANAADVPETTTELEEAIYNSEEMSNLLERRKTVEQTVGGDR